MENEKERFISVEDDFIDDHKRFLRVEIALLDIEKDKIRIKTPTGEEKPFKLSPGALLIYILLTRSVYKQPGQEPQTEVSLNKLEKRSGIRERTIREHLKTLEEARLIEKIERPGYTNLYRIKRLSESNILYDRQENGEYVHKELEKYIEYIQKRDAMILEKHLGEMDFITMAILETFGIREIDLTGEERRKLKEIRESGMFSKGELIDQAELFSRNKKGLSDFIQHFTEMMERQKSPEKLISLSDGAEIFGLEKEKDRD